jgi:DNA-binding GntR family transcriptional regulator
MQRFAPRANLSDDLVIRLRDLIVSGELPAGERLNEVHLAARLGVSRTPLREALARLGSECAVMSVPRLGFFVCPLTREEVEHLYPMRALLDPAALRQGGPVPPVRLARLKALNERFGAAPDAREAVRLDDRWHLELIAGCTNPILLGLIEQMIWRTRRYELALMDGRINIDRATGDHDAIIAALEAGDLDAACQALERNMLSGKQPILDWLAQREKQG